MMVSEETPSQKYAKEIFSEQCRRRIGIVPIDDDGLVLKAAVEFGEYINNFKSLDRSKDWHRHMIDVMVMCKIDTLARKIESYGLHEKYPDRSRLQRKKGGGHDQEDLKRRHHEVSGVQEAADQGQS